jgi:hypothetical protein
MAALSGSEVASQKNTSKIIGFLQKRTKENIATPDYEIAITAPLNSSTIIYNKNYQRTD